ncbi:MAG: hypothetical protein RLZZ26_377 [Candidatus Parcubacteria bacterium]|jgi:tryptophanyl-tRNA synthetase
MSEHKTVLLTGLQSSGELHIGNYFGALKPFVETYTNHTSYLMVADYHALTSVRKPEVLRESISAVVKDYLAVGVDPTQAVIFKQSDVPAHTELAWIFDCLVTVPFLMQGHAYKDKVAKGLDASAGLFTYPMLMAADILLYDTDLVPVGEDQRQHIEYAREAAAKFNNAYGTLFKEPKETILKGTGVIPGTDGEKMAKSRPQFTIPLFASKDELAQRVMSIVTDSSGDRPENVYAIHKLFRSEAELESLYEAKRGKYKELKDALVEDMDKYLAPLRTRRLSITDAHVAEILAKGGERARTVSEDKMRQVRAAIGVS